MSATHTDFRSLGDFGSLGLNHLGDFELLTRPLLAIFSSAKCPAGLILKAHDYAKEIHNGEMGIVSGFHAPAEKEVLEVLLKGTCPIVVALGRSLENARMPSAWRPEIDKGRLLVVSNQSNHIRRVTRESMQKANDLAARLAGRVLIIHASQGGNLQAHIARWRQNNIEIHFLSEEINS